MDSCRTCPDTGIVGVGRAERVVCRCLQVTESALVEALTTLQLRTLKDVRRHTGAGDGCTACHKRLCRYLELYGAQPCPAPPPPSSEPPICSVR
jgi:NAD(P)H-nitrite reductase large subunit